MSVEINTEQFASEVQAKAAENSGTQTNQAADPSPIEDAHRVYVGNINFKVTEGNCATVGEGSNIARCAERTLLICRADVCFSTASRNLLT